MDLEILQDYLVESRELLANAQTGVLRLEAMPDDEEALASIFRAFHTIKGGACFLEATHLVEWAHDLEELLDRLRSRALPVDTERIDAILKGIDVIEQMFAELALEQYPAPGPAGLSRTIRSLAMTAGDEPEEAEAWVPAAAGLLSAWDGTTAARAGTPPAARMCDLPEGIPESNPEANPEVNREANRDVIGRDESEAETGSGSYAEARLTAGEQARHAPSPVLPRSGETVESTLRVDAGRLDAVMNQVGELVLLRNRLSSAVGSAGKENEEMSRITREMDLTVNDLQNTVMRLRMQPCKRLFQQLPRVVRDVSRQLGKEVRLEIVGEDVEIDKTVVDALSGPMTHLVRNSLDHGIEMPAVRLGAHKDPTAVLRVAAVHLGDKVRIEVSDDGQGIDRRFVTQRAIDKGLITEDYAARLSEQESLELIFRPGFSTKEQASDLSGRGVGMDVVRETTNQLRGRLSVETRLGQGTSVAMEFPLTLAVLPVLYMRVRQEVYALPISAIDSLTDLENHRVHRLAGTLSYRVDGARTIPLVDLGAILQNRPIRLGGENAEGVLTERGLFVVSEVLGNEDSVVKPIDFFSGRNLYQGATISGQGNVVLILDAGALSAAAASQGEGEA